MYLLLALHCATPSSVSTLDPTHPISLSLPLSQGLDSFLSYWCSGFLARKRTSVTIRASETNNNNWEPTTRRTKLATENPRKYIQEEGPASPPQVERFCKASPSLGVDMENGSRMRRTQKRENKNTTKRTTSTATTTTTAAEEARTWSSLQSRQKKERRETKKKENWILLWQTHNGKGSVNWECKCSSTSDWVKTETLKVWSPSLPAAATTEREREPEDEEEDEDEESVVLALPLYRFAIWDQGS